MWAAVIWPISLALGSYKHCNIDNQQQKSYMYRQYGNFRFLVDARGSESFYGGDTYCHCHA